MIPAFAADLAAHGDAPCILRDGAAPVTYAGLAARADAFARRLGAGRKLVAIEAAVSVEAALAGQGLVAAVWGDDTRLYVAFEGAGGADDVAARVAALAGLVPSHIRARAVAYLPRLPSGKIDYPALTCGPYDPLPDHATGLADAFAAAFHPRTVGPRDTFAALGGDPLRHVELALAVERALGHLPDR